MPIDPSIVSALAPQAGATSTLAGQASMMNAYEAQRKAQEERQRRQRIESILSSSTDPDAAINEINKFDVEYGSKLRTQMDGHRESVARRLKSDLDNDDAQVKLVSAIGKTIHDAATLDNGRQMLSGLGPEGQKLAGMLPQQWDDATSPAQMQQFLDFGLSAADYTKRQKEALDKFVSGDYRRGIADMLATADTPEEAQGVLAAAKAYYVPKAVLDEFAPMVEQWSPTMQARMGDLALTTKDRETRDTARMNAETARMNATKTAAETGFTLGEGQKRFVLQPDGTWKQVATGGPKTATPGSGGGGGGTGTTATKMPPQARSVLARVLTGMPGTRTGTIQQEANRLAAAGDEARLKSYLRYAATQKVGEARQTAMQGRMETLSALKDAEAILKEVPTGYLKGSFENVARSLGKTTDPRLVELGTRMGNILAQYMRSISGAAVNESEAARLSALIPNYKNDLTVNLAQLKGFSESIKSFDKAFYQNTFGDDYDWVMGGNQPTAGAGGGGTTPPPPDTTTAPPQVLAAGPGRHTFKNGQTWEVSPDGKSARRINK